MSHFDYHEYYPQLFCILVDGGSDCNSSRFSEILLYIADNIKRLKVKDSFKYIGNMLFCLGALEC